MEKALSTMRVGNDDVQIKQLKEAKNSLLQKRRIQKAEEKAKTITNTPSLPT